MIDIIHQQVRISGVTPILAKGLLPALRSGSGPWGGAADHGPFANCVGGRFFWSLAMKASFRPILGSRGRDCFPRFAREAAHGVGLQITAPSPTALAGAFLVRGRESKLSADLGYPGTGLLPALRSGSGPWGGAADHGPSANCVGGCFFWSLAMKASSTAKTKKAPHTLCEGLVLCGPDGTRTRDPLRDRQVF